MTTTGTRLGNYQLGETLGSSGLATSYHAVDTRSGQPVTLKILRSYFSDEEELVQRFFQELDQLQAAPHPGLLLPLDRGHQDGSYWFAREYAPEESLRTAWSAPGGLAPALLVLDGVAEALEHLLAQGLTYRNLKPGNVFWDPARGAVRLADFGMATLGEGSHPLMRTALTTPLPAYMAPEYIAERQADARSETFSLAVLAYWLLTGELPYTAEAPATMYTKAMRYDVTPVSHLNPAVSREVDRVVLHALAPFPAVRPASPRAFVQALRKAAADGPSPPQPGSQEAVLAGAGSTQEAEAAPAVAVRGRLGVDISLLERIWRAPRRRTRRERIARGVLLLSFVAAAALGYAAWTKPPDLPPPTSAISAEVGDRRWALARHDLLNSGYAPVSTAAIRGELLWKYQTGAPFLASPTSDGDTVYAATGDRRVLALDAATGELQWQTPLTEPVEASPVAAGDFVYIGLRDGQIIALYRASGEPRWKFTPDFGVVGSSAVSDGVLYQGSRGGKLYALDAATGGLRWSFDTGAWIVAQPAVVEDAVIIGDSNGWLHFLDKATGRERFRFYTRASLYTAPAVAGDTVYVSTIHGRLFAVDLNERSGFQDRERYIAQRRLYIWGMAALPIPKGRRWVAALPGSLTSSPAIAHGMVYVGTNGDRLRALDAATGETVWEFAAQSPVLGSPVVSEDVLYAGTDDGKLYAIDAKSGEPRWWFQTGGRIRTSAAVAGGTVFVTSEDGALYALK